MRPLDPRLLPLLRPAARSLVGLVAAGVVGSVLLVAQTFAVAHLVVVVVRGEVDRLPTAAALALLAFAARAAVGLVGDLCSARASAEVATSLRGRLVAATIELPAEEMSRQRGGELALLVTRGVAAIDPYLTRYLPALVLAAVLPPLTLVAIGTQDLLSAAIVAVTLPLVPVFAALVGLATRDRAQRQWRALGSLAGHFVDVVRGLPTLVVHRRATAQSGTIRRVADAHRRATLSTLRLAFASSAVLELVATLSVALVAVTVGVRLAAGSVGLPVALVVLLLAPEAYWPLRRVGAEFHAAAEGTATLTRALELLDAVPVDPATSPATTPTTVPSTWPGVHLEDVRVTYPHRAGPALDLPGRLSLPASGLVAVTGPSGSGKSTLLGVLAGELAPGRGRVRAGPLLLDEASLGWWRTQVSWVPQRPWLVDGSVRQAIGIGRPDASEADLWQALARVGLRDVVASLPGGLEAPVGEDGERFSAGQRARLALARAVVAARPLVLVDEPSAHLDARTEAAVVDTLRWLARRSTVVAVTHSATLAAAADTRVALEAPVPAGTVPVATGTAPVPAAAPRPEAASTVTARPGEADRTSRLSRGSRGWSLTLLLGTLAASCGIALTVTSGWLITRAAEHPPLLFLMVAIVGVRAFGIGRPLFRYAERLVGHDAALRMLAGRRAEVYDTVVPLTPGALGRRRGDVLASVVDDVDAVLDDRLRVRLPLLTLACVGVLAAGLGTLLLPVAGAAVAALVLATFATALVVRATVGRVERDLVRQRGLLSTRVLEAVQSARHLVLWQATGAAAGRVQEASSELARSIRRSAARVAVGRGAVSLLAGAALTAVAAGGTAEVAAGRLTGPAAAAALLLPLALLDVLAPVPDAAALSVRTRAARARLDALAQATPAVTSPDPAVPAPGPPLAAHAESLSAGWTSPVFEHLDLALPAGTRAGVVGPSGSGKSTLAAVLVRFVDPLSGQVRLDGTDLRRLHLDDVHRLVGLVDDDPYVFASSVLENVRLARPGASRAEVERVLREVSLGTWLDALPQGLDTLVGEGRDAVSGGERARLGLARALLADQPVLVLDEPTAHLDTTTAEAVAADVLDATRGRTLVWITHDAVALDAVDLVVDLGQHAVRQGVAADPWERAS
jgi:ATP-binding cassette, subfamily C, bacterial CydCD